MQHVENEIKLRVPNRFDLRRLCAESNGFTVSPPQAIDSMKLLEEAVAQNVAFVPGGPFFASEAQHNTLRLSFVTVPPAKIDEGIAKQERADR